MAAGWADHASSVGSLTVSAPAPATTEGDVDIWDGYLSAQVELLMTAGTGPEWRPEGDPVRVADHNFVTTSPQAQQAIPYGVYDLTAVGRSTPGRRALGKGPGSSRPMPCRSSRE
jgi:hypothetical protein